MRILVTGYGGFLGSEICRQLIRNGFEVMGLARNSYSNLVRLGVEPLLGDVASPKTCRAACRGCHAVIHTAAKAGVWGAWKDYYRSNTLATMTLIESAKQAGVRAFVYTSSPSVTFAGLPQSGVDESVPYPTRWLSHYPHSKALGEQAVSAAAEYGSLLTCSLRPHLIWGEGDPHLFPRLIQRARSGRLLRVGRGKNLIDVVHVSSAAKAHLLAVLRLLDGDRGPLDDGSGLNGKSLFITDGQPVECWDWISQILTAAGLTVPSRSISFRKAYALGAMLETLYRLSGRQNEPPMTRFVAAQLALDHYFSIERARRLLGYNPQIDREADMARCQPWLRKLASGPTLEFAS